MRYCIEEKCEVIVHLHTDASPDSCDSSFETQQGASTKRNYDKRFLPNESTSPSRVYHGFDGDVYDNAAGRAIDKQLEQVHAMLQEIRNSAAEDAACKAAY